jgi:hypothetical protein
MTAVAVVNAVHPASLHDGLKSNIHLNFTSRVSSPGTKQDWRLTNDERRTTNDERRTTTDD